MAIKCILKEIDEIFDADGQIQYFQVDVSANNDEESAYATAHLRITQDDLSNGLTLGQLNTNWIGNYALQKARTYFQKLTTQPSEKPKTDENKPSAGAKTTTETVDTPNK